MGGYEALEVVEVDVHIVPRVINHINHLKRVLEAPKYSIYFEYIKNWRKNEKICRKNVTFGVFGAP